MASAGVKGFFREKKKSKAGAAKKSKHSADVVQPPALLDLQADYDEKEKVLREFDVNMAYGPCIGMNRLERWERAKKLGLNPPAQVEDLLKTEKVDYLCLWDGRV